MLKNSLIIACLSIASTVYGQQDVILNFNYENSHSLVLNSNLSLEWSGDSFYYRWENNQGNTFYRGNVKSRKKELLFSEHDIQNALRNYGEKDVEKFKIYRINAVANESIYRFKFNNKDFAYNWEKKILVEQKPIQANTSSNNISLNSKKPYWQKYNYDSTAYIYAKGHQLFIRTVQNDQELKLTDDGEKDFSYNSTANKDYKGDEVGSTFAVWAGNYIISIREDKRAIEEMTIINALKKPKPSYHSYKFPMPGDHQIIQYKVEIWDTESLQKREVKVVQEEGQRLVLPGQLINGRTYLFAPRLGENPNGIYFLRRTRANDRVEFCYLEYKSGEVRVILDETIKPHVNEQLFQVHVLPNANEFLYWSERSGYGQYYRYHINGKLLNKVGPFGDYVMGNVVSFDVEKKSAIIEAYGYEKDNSPYLKQYLRCDLFSNYGKLLTPEINFQHSIQIADNKRYILSQYSSIDKPVNHVIRDTTGRMVMQLGKADIRKLDSVGWKAPEKIKLKAADDSTYLYGLMYKPQSFDPNQKYAVISSVYPGPQDDFVPHSFTIDDNYHQSLADLGFIVLQIPSRGSSPYRGLKFHSYSYGNMRDYALADNKHSIEVLAKDRPYMDLNKVGIFGHSGGGFMSATAILTYPDFYKVAVAASGNHDPNIYTQWWGETYHGLRNKQNGPYIPSTIELAKNLKGKLFLITGDQDNNVHPAHTLRLADALIKENKFFDMMILPGKDHGLGDRYYQNLIRRYFLQHLKNYNDTKDQ